MKYGVFLPSVGVHAGPGALAEVAQAAEDLGFASVWTGDHLVFPAHYETPYPDSQGGRMPFEPDRPYFEAFTTLSFVAGVTKRVRLGVGVCVVPYRHPVVLAKTFASLDALSSGRAVLGVGVGWLREEFDAIGVPFEQRASMTNEALELLEQVYSSDGPVSYEGRHVRLDRGYIRPVPERDEGVPIYVGGVSRAALRRTARFGSGWYPYLTGMSPTRLRDGLVHLAAARDTSKPPLACALWAPTAMTGEESPDVTPPWEKGSLEGSPVQIAAWLREYAAASVDEVVLGIGGSPGVRIRAMERFAADVMPLVEHPR